MKTPSGRGRAAGVVAVVVAAVAVVLVVLGPCGGGGGPGGTGNGDGSTATSRATQALEAQAKQVTAAVLGGDGAGTAVASAQGTVRTYGGVQPAVAEVLSVEMTGSAILLRWRLKSTGPLLDLRPETLRESPGTEAADVALVDPVAQRQAKPSRFKESFGVRCTCSIVPNGIDGTGQILTGLYPLLAEDTKQVEVRIPGFPPIQNVTVTRT